MSGNPYGWSVLGLLLAGTISLVVVMYWRSRIKWLRQARRLAILAALYPDRTLTGLEITSLVPTVNAVDIYSLLNEMDDSWVTSQVRHPASSPKGNKAIRAMHRHYTLSEQGHRALRVDSRFDFLTRPNETLSR